MRLLSAYFFPFSKMQNFSHLHKYEPIKQKIIPIFLSYINYMIYICKNKKRPLNAFKITIYLRKTLLII